MQLHQAFVSELWLDTLPGEMTALVLLRCALCQDAAQLGTNKHTWQHTWQPPCSELWLNTLPRERDSFVLLEASIKRRAYVLTCSCAKHIVLQPYSASTRPF
jgi:hypothetical protein